MTKKLFAAAAITVALLAPARADYIIKDGNGVTKTIKAGTVSGNILPYSTPTDATGIPYSAANPLAITFGTGAVLPDFNQPQHFICDSGCGGGGGGGGLSVPFFGAIGANGTPVGFKDVSGNFQPLLGDVTNGQWMNIKASVPIAVTGTFFQATQPVSLTSLPGYAATPTFNMGTIAGIATQTTLAAIQTALGSPLQTGGTIGNTSFGISGTLPAFATPPAVKLQDGSGNSISSTTGSLNVNITGGAGSGGTSSTFGAAFPTLGTAVGMTQGGNLVALSGTSGNLNVQCANCSGSGVSTADGATFTAGSSLFAGSGGIYQTTATNSPMTSGQQGLFQMTINRAMHTNLRNAVGVEVGVAAVPLQVSLANTAANATAIKVDGSAVTQPVSGTVTANLGTIAGVATQTTLASILTNLGSPFQAGGSIGNTTFAATQASAAALNATVVGTGTFAVQATIATPASWGIGTTTQNSATVANGQMALGQFNTTPTTITSGNMSPLQMDNAGNLLVNIKAGSASGAVAQGSTTSGQTGGLTQAAATSAAPSYTTATTNPLSMDLSGNLRVTTISGFGTAANQATIITALNTLNTNVTAPPQLNVNTVATAWTGLTPGVAQTGTIVAANVDMTSLGGVAFGAMANYGTSPGAVKVQGVNANVTNFPAVQPVSHSTTPTVANGNGIVLAASATNGATPSGIIAANSNNSTSLKGSAGTVYGIQTSNINATTPYYLKLYDKATAPTCGTDTPVARYVIPPNFSGNNVSVVVGKKFTLGIGYCIVTGIADNDNTSVPAATILANIDYN